MTRKQAQKRKRWRASSSTSGCCCEKNKERCLSLLVLVFNLRGPAYYLRDIREGIICRVVILIAGDRGIPVDCPGARLRTRDVSPELEHRHAVFVHLHRDAGRIDLY